jgi:multiple sugar transport system ATP-binding protein
MTLGQRIGVMKDGKLLQVADPNALYTKPVNRFVAGFIGSPPMNFLDGRIERGEPLRFVHPALSIPVPSAFNDRLSPVVGGPVVLGVRPECMRVAPAGAGAVVEVAEQMGNEVMLYLKLGEETLVARVPPDQPPRPGETVGIQFTPDRLHFFDPKTELTLV